LAQPEKHIIGRADRIDIPRFGACDIRVKVDTGAYTSAIHCSRIKVRRRNGKKYIVFRILDSHIPLLEHRRYVTSQFSRKPVRSSSGHVEKRYFIKAHVLLFGRRILAEFSLSDRETMRYPVLLGRKLLKNKFLVDVSLTNVSFTEKYRREMPEREQLKIFPPDA